MLNANLKLDFKTFHWTGIVFILSIATFGMSSLQDVFIYDRAAILSGQLWRLFTSHLVHCSYKHLFYDLSVFCIAGMLIERREKKAFVWLSVLSAFAISVTLLFAKSKMDYYGGLSGLACTAVIYYILLELRLSNASSRVFWLGVLLLTLAKFVYEIVTGKFIFVCHQTQFVPMPLSHSVGGLVAFVFFLCQVNLIIRTDQFRYTRNYMLDRVFLRPQHRDNKP
jgi:rhomboid family GlyGly-CTERM serine protease